ncbi:DedA family protein [Rhodococcus oryzae]|uniref:DedA family protein n=1 Tax=Rhodococcus oryzae TaxID=2571143 RepID=UPI0037B40009
MDIPDLPSMVTGLGRMLDVDNLTLAPAPLLFVVVAVLLVVESGYLIGLVLPGNSIPLTLGMLVASGALHAVHAVVVVAVSSCAGAQLAFARARRHGTCVLPEMLGRPLPDRVAAWQRWLHEQSGSRPRSIAVCGHMIGGVRTLAPRVLAGTRLRRSDFTMASVAAATLWAMALVSVGSIVGDNEVLRTAYGFAWIPVVLVAVGSRLRDRSRL